MPNFKVTFLFNSDERGFSETYYKTASDTAAALAAAKLWGQLRYNKMGMQMFFAAIKVQDDAEFGDSDVDTDCRTFFNSGFKGEISASGALVRIQAGTKHRRSMIFRGFPDDYIITEANTNRLIATDPLKNALKEYGDFLVANNWQIRYTLDDEEADPDPTPVIDLTRDDDNKGVTLVSTANWNEYQKGDQLLIRGCRGKARSLNGVHNVAATPAGNKVSIDWPYGRVERWSAEDIASATCRGYDHGYADITKARYIDIRTRQTGRAFFSPAGKSKSRL